MAADRNPHTPEAEGLEPPFSDPLVEQLRRWAEEAGLPTRGRIWPVLLKQLLVTLGLLCLWETARRVPLPVLDWEAVRAFGSLHGNTSLLGLWMPVDKTSILAVGYSPYILGHLFLFWIVVLLPNLRKSGFRERVDLDRPLYALTFLAAVLSGLGALRVCWGLYTERGVRLVAAYYLENTGAYYGLGLCALLGGTAFTLWVLKSIRRHGLPFPLTCMVLWALLFPLALDYARLPVSQWGLADPRGTVRVALLVAGILLAAVALATGFWLYTSRIGQRARAGERPPRPMSITDIPFALFGLLTANITVGVWRGLAQALPHLGDAGRAVAEHMALPELSTPLRTLLLQHGVFLGLAVLSTLVFHRLTYNPALEQRLAEEIGSGEALPQRSYGRTLATWACFYCLVAALDATRIAFWSDNPLLTPLARPRIWDLVLLALAVGAFALYAQRLRLGLVVPVYRRGYYEPLSAAKALLEMKGFRVAVGIEPYSLLYGQIVGPLGRKELLVSPEEAPRAWRALERAGLFRAVTAPSKGTPAPPKSEV